MSPLARILISLEALRRSLVLSMRRQYDTIVSNHLQRRRLLMQAHPNKIQSLIGQGTRLIRIPHTYLNCKSMRACGAQGLPNQLMIMDSSKVNKVTTALAPLSSEARGRLLRI